MSPIRTAKEIARHLFYTVGIRRNAYHLNALSRVEKFSRIYQEGVWSLGRHDTPLSGNGSSMAATEKLRRALPEFINQLGVGKLIDVGCGDFTWMSQLELSCRYVGIDIVPWLVERNIAEFASARREFRAEDIVNSPAPKGDLILCREELFYLSIEDGIAALRNMLASGYSHLLLTTDRVTSFNAQIVSGDFRIINLERPLRASRAFAKN